MAKKETETKIQYAVQVYLSVETSNPELSMASDQWRFLLWAMWATAQGAIYLGAHERSQTKKREKKSVRLLKKRKARPQKEKSPVF